MIPLDPAFADVAGLYEHSWFPLLRKKGLTAFGFWPGGEAAMSGHNYYLYERGGVLSMLPWDYNLAFGTMMMKPEYAVNDPIDEPMAVKSDGNHPMFEWITADPAYRQKYYSALEQTIV